MPSKKKQKPKQEAENRTPSWRGKKNLQIKEKRQKEEENDKKRTGQLKEGNQNLRPNSKNL